MTLPPLFRPFARTCTSLSGKFNPCNVVSDCSGAEVSLVSCPKTWIHSWGIPAVRRSFNALVACSCVGNRLTRVVSVGFAIVVSTFQIQSIILVITVESLKRLNRSGDGDHVRMVALDPSADPDCLNGLGSRQLECRRLEKCRTPRPLNRVCRGITVSKKTSWWNEADHWAAMITDR